ncbi:MAG: IS21 family transposase [Burkholderiales bacterium]
MQAIEVTQALPGVEMLGRQSMQTPEEVTAMLRLAQAGVSVKRIAVELGCSKNTVKRYLRAGGWIAYRKPARGSRLAGLKDWLAERFRQHRGNADVVRQDLAREQAIVVSLRTVERAVQGLRRELRAETVATIRFETAPGEQLQIDFGTVTVPIGGEPVKVKLFVATLGYSRRPYVALFEHERQSAWLNGIEEAFRHFGGLPRELLLDNARALIERHDAKTREVQFNARFHAFCRYWSVTPRACAPYRARTKGKDERGVGYVKRNAIAGHRFATLEALRAHLAWWMREVADVRVHGTTGEPPIERFQREERTALRPLGARAPWGQVRELVRRVHTDSCVEVDTNRYSVPWRLIGETVTVVLAANELTILHAGREIARHGELAGRRASAIDRRHLLGVVGAAPKPRETAQAPEQLARSPELLRPLAEYEAAMGGAW